jgi:hypothetical protein
MVHSSMHEKEMILAAYMADLDAAKSAAQKWQSANNILEVCDASLTLSVRPSTSYLCLRLCCCYAPRVCW